MRATGHFVRAAFTPQAVHWSPLWFLASGFAFSPPCSDFGRLPLAVIRFAGVMAWLSGALFLMRRWSIGRFATAAALLLIAFHQGGTGALDQWKSIGTIGANAFGIWSAVLLIGDRNPLEELSRRRGIGAALLLFAALLFKETALSYAAFAGLLLVVSMIGHKPRHRRLRLIARIAPLIIAAGLFLFLRTILGAPMSSADELHPRYQLGSFSEVMRNAAFLLAGVSTPISTVRWFDAVTTSHWSGVALFCFATVVANIVMLRGMRRSPRDRMLIVLLGLITSFVPVVLMNHVSETYLSAGVFWYAILVALSLQSVDAPRRWVAVVSIVLALHLWAFSEKVALTGRSAAAELRTAEMAAEMLTRLPPGSIVTMKAPEEGRNGYSVYRAYYPRQAVMHLAERRHLPIEFINDGKADYELTIWRDRVTVAQSRTGATAHARTVVPASGK
jgi:hypothetical protein